jgi:hypothetical protein
VTVISGIVNWQVREMSFLVCAFVDDPPSLASRIPAGNLRVACQSTFALHATVDKPFWLARPQLESVVSLASEGW